MTQWWQVIVLAVVQGVAEFLPISSSGHVVVVGSLFGVREISDLNIVLHVGTLFSIVVFYWSRILRLLDQDRRLVPLLAVATIPAAAIGVPLKKWGSQVLESPLLTGFMLIATGLMLLLLRGRKPGDRGLESVSWREALGIGFAQAAAILPGLSRSGSTIATGLWRNLTPAAAATFSFLMALPIIAAGGAYELLSQRGDASEGATSTAMLVGGAAIAFLVGLGSLAVLSRLLEHGRLDRCAWWCIPLGVGVVAWQLLAG